jgi:hypothetical protein
MRLILTTLVISLAASEQTTRAVGGHTFESCRELCGTYQSGQPDFGQTSNSGEDNSLTGAESSETKENSRRLSVVFPEDQECTAFDFCNFGKCAGTCTLIFGFEEDEQVQPLQDGGNSSYDVDYDNPAANFTTLTFLGFSWAQCEAKCVSANDGTMLCSGFDCCPCTITFYTLLPNNISARQQNPSNGSAMRKVAKMAPLLLSAPQTSAPAPPLIDHAPTMAPSAAATAPRIGHEPTMAPSAEPTQVPSAPATAQHLASSDFDDPSVAFQDSVTADRVDRVAHQHTDQPQSTDLGVMVALVIFALMGTAVIAVGHLIRPRATAAANGRLQEYEQVEREGELEEREGEMEGEGGWEEDQGAQEEGLESLECHEDDWQEGPGLELTPIKEEDRQHGQDGQTGQAGEERGYSGWSDD